MDKTRKCSADEFESIYGIINDSARAYKGVIPADCWKEPYMARSELQSEIDRGVVFWGYELEGELNGVMGIQSVEDVTLVRHAYILTAKQNLGFGGRLLTYLLTRTPRPIMVGTWADALWAIRFYERHGFNQVAVEEKVRLLHRYWSVPDRQVRSSVVLVRSEVGEKTIP